MSLQLDRYEVQAGLQEVLTFDVYGLTDIISNRDGKASQDINRLWQRFFEESIGHKIACRADDVIYAVYSDYEGDHTLPYRLTIGYRVDSQTINSLEPFHCIHVKSGTYAVLSARGEQPSALIQTWQSVWESDLNREFSTDFEMYGPRFFEEGVHEVLVCVGLKDS